jgi:hypothetical protein
VQLQEKHGDQVHAIAMNVEFDGRSDALSAKEIDKINEVLTAKEIVVHNIICTDPIDDALEKLNVASIPAVLVFDTTGKLAKKFDGEVTYVDDVIPFVTELVAKSSDPAEAEEQ